MLTDWLPPSLPPSIRPTQIMAMGKKNRVILLKKLTRDSNTYPLREH